jgi:glucose/arabinose dehydrogenase
MHRRTLLKTGLLVPAALSAPALVASTAEAAPRVGATLARGLSFPWGIGFLRDGSALVTERNSGRVLRVRPRGGYSVVGRVPGVFNDGGEGGLLGLALSPRFATDRWVYAFLTTRTDNRIVRMKYVGGELGRPRVVLAGIPRNQRHNGGGLMFTRGANPSLFATTGDSQRPELAQNRRSLAGKVLRMKPNGAPQDGNPFGNRVFSYGHRNPEGIARGEDGRLWLSELGENTWDELNLLRRGRNYGWPREEGSDGAGGYANPYSQWDPADCSPSGIALVHGHAWVGALRGECLWSVDISDEHRHRKIRHFHQRFGRIRMVKRAPDNSLWIGTSNGDGQDRIVRIRLG